MLEMLLKIVSSAQPSVMETQEAETHHGKKVKLQLRDREREREGWRERGGV